MGEEFYKILLHETFKIEQETGQIQKLIEKSNDNEISKIVDLGKLKSELNKYCDKILGHIDSIRGVL